MSNIVLVDYSPQTLLPRHPLVNPVQIIYQGLYCRLLAGPSSGYALDLLLLGFVTKILLSNYSAITPTH